MANRTTPTHWAALDIGTSKVSAIVGEWHDDGRLTILGYDVQPSTGLKQGVVINVESTTQAIQKAVQAASAMSGCEIRSVTVGVAGKHIHSLNSNGIVPIRHDEVTADDIDRVIDAARAVAMPADQQILHILPQEFIIDHQDGVREPIGISGVRLEARVHIVTGAVAAIQNITKCVSRCGLTVRDIVLEPLASSEAVLTDDEKELGVCLVDIGGGTTDIAIFTQGSLQYTAVLPVAGDHVTQDVASVLRTPVHFAEQMKIDHGSVLIDRVDPRQQIQVPGVAKRPTRKVSVRALSQVVAARYQEIFRLVRQEIRNSGLEEFLAAGIVLTGGAANVSGAVTLAESILRLPARVGLPMHLNGLASLGDNPRFATGVGLLRYAYRQSATTTASQPKMAATSVFGVWSRMKAWFSGNF